MATNEVAQSARHSITNFTAESEIKLHLLEREISALPPRHMEKALRQIAEVRENLSAINKQVQMIKESARVPDKVWMKADIGEICEAFDMVSGRLANNEIKVQVSPVRLKAVVCREFLRQAFLQLIFNSIDAFKDTRQGQPTDQSYHRGRRAELELYQGSIY